MPVPSPGMTWLAYHYETWSTVADEPAGRQWIAAAITRGQTALRDTLNTIDHDPDALPNGRALHEIAVDIENLTEDTRILHATTGPYITILGQPGGCITGAVTQAEATSPENDTNNWNLYTGLWNSSNVPDSWTSRYGPATPNTLPFPT